MTLQREILRDAAIGVGVAETPDGLSTIHHPGCAATIWKRQPLLRFQAWIDAEPPKALPRARIMLRPSAVHQAVTEIVQTSGLSDTPERAMLVDDVSALAEIFAHVMRAPYLRLRLDRITTNACRKFHIDTLTARLVCTYRGPGTQYGISTDGAEPQRIFDVPTGSPIVLRGTEWPEAPRSGLLHRSPPIEGTGQTRAVLVLDPVTQLAAEIDQQFYH